MNINKWSDFLSDIKVLTGAREVDFMLMITSNALCKQANQSMCIEKMMDNIDVELHILYENSTEYICVEDDRADSLINWLGRDKFLSKKDEERVREVFSKVFAREECHQKLRKALTEDIRDIDSSYKCMTRNPNEQEDRMIIRFQRIIACDSVSEIVSEDRKYYFLNERSRVNEQIYMNNYMCRKKEELLAYLSCRDMKKNGQRKMSEAVLLQDGKYDVILPAGSGALFFHECIGHPLEIQYANKKESIFYNKIGERITDSQLTFVDDATIKDLWGSYNMDDVGVPAQKIVLIDKGVLKNYLVDKYSGIELGIPATSSCRKEPGQCKPTARMSNTYVAAGNDIPSQIYASFESGIIIREIKIGHVNPITGEFYLLILEGDLISNYKSVGKVTNVEVETTTLEILNNIQMIGNDLKFTSGFCIAESGKVPVCGGQPTIRINQVNAKQKM